MDRKLGKDLYHPRRPTLDQNLKNTLRAYLRLHNSEVLYNIRFTYIFNWALFLSSKCRWLRTMGINANEWKI